MECLISKLPQDVIKLLNATEIKAIVVSDIVL